jgi:hypothetical protein
MYCFASLTVKKWRDTSSIEPRHAKRGRSTTVPTGIVHAFAARWPLSSASIPGGRSWRTVCTP